jgi:2-C-methyl-D-erythritol 4-phosphate cytidylyltransferase
MINVGAVIVAAGNSQRMGSDKMFASLGGRPIITRVIDTFLKCKEINSIVVVLNEKNLDKGKKLLSGYKIPINICLGGQRRQDSVYNGLKKLGQCHLVVVHDGARPLVTASLIEKGISEASEFGTAIAAVPVKDTIKLMNSIGAVKQTLDRNNLYNVQTPQVFHYNILLTALEKIDEEITDDSSAIEKMGYKVKMYMGSYDNIKITTMEDLYIARAILKKLESR